MSLISSMSSIDNSLEGGGSASASGKKGVIQLSDGNFNLTSNKDLKSDPATGTITTTGLTTTGTVFAATISTSNLVADTVTELTVVGDASITGNAIVDGSVSATIFDGDGGILSNVQTTDTLQSVTTRGAITTDTITVGALTTSGFVQGATISSTGNVNATGNLVATGSLTGASATVSGQVQGATVSSTGHVNATGSLSGASATVSGQVQGATVSSTGQVIATGSLSGASATVSGQVQGATVSSTGSIIATSTVTGSHVNTPTLVVSKDAQITGNLTVSGGLVTITSTTTGTNQINITNNGTGPALIAKQTGDEPIVNFLDGSTSVFFISGGELTDKDGFVGLGTETPQERLDVQGNIVSSGTISSTNVATSNLTVTNFHSVTGTLTASNIVTSNLTVSNRLSGGTISVSNIEATANLVVGGPADITGTLSAADFIGSGDGINDLNASNITSGTLNNARLPGTISVSNIEATANLVVGGPADITGTLSAADFIGSGDGINDLNASNVTSGTLNNLRLPGTISVSNVEATANLVVGGPADITGTLSAADFIGSGDGINDLNASNVTSGTLNNLRLPGTISVSNVEATANLVVGGPADITGTLSVGGSLTGPSLTVSGDVQGTSASLGAIDGSSLTVSGDVQGTSASLGVIDGTSIVVTGDVQGLNLTSTGTLSSAGITSSDNVTITGADKSLTASNISTSNLTVSNFHSITGTLSASNVETSNLTVSNRLSGGTISVSNLEATANLVVGGPADITGTLSAADFIGSGDGIDDLNASNVTSGTLNNARLPGTISVSNLEATANLVVGGPADITGTLSAGGSLTGASATVSGQVQGATILSTGSLTGASATVSGQVQGATILSTGSLTGSSLTVSGDVEGASASLGAIDGSSLTVTGDVQGASASLGVIDGTSVVVTGTVQGLNLTSTGILSTSGLTSSADSTVTGILTATANITAGGNVVATNNTYASFFFGDGGLLSNVSGGGTTPTLQEVTTQGSTTSDLVTVGGLSSTAAVNVTGTISATGDITAFSDKRHKEDLLVIESALDKVKRLTGYTYTLHGNRSAGLLAQDVLDVLPEVVKGSEETNYSLAYGNLMGLVVEAIKELDKKVDRILEKHGST